MLHANPCMESVSRAGAVSIRFKLSVSGRLLTLQPPRTQRSDARAKRGWLLGYGWRRHRLEQPQITMRLTSNGDPYLVMKLDMSSTCTEIVQVLGTPAGIAPIRHGGSRMSPVALAPHPNIISVGRIASPFVTVDYMHL